ncbi:DNA methyltransferase [Rhodanobacter sp. Root179]|jgi:very-short-patch-repair endonuclease|uniref:endonuclease domain-containing protein n=1 Tax=unclassified Rhodanobacter TaxID=2621553 RepID=UPI0006F35932|nr:MULTISPECIES: endonuclease domain-containing protein [unclassified Rhodanobacter]KQZ71234.1 DNA methyltransferase [Rhodanobacter sp. Root561]KRB42737.1 DNA methyltransferase [Rhodanobacter sp. Root179]
MRDHAKTTFARQLRRAMTPAEHHLWARLRQRQLGGCRFRRQHPLGPYIVDFACLEKHLVVEVDGSGHLDSVADVGRDDWLRQHGFTVVRCWNHDVLDRTELVLEVILGALG